MEKPLAEAAGLGWQGKHTNLVSRELGSWLFLGAIFTTLELPPDAPEHDHCGTCRACLDICPTAAFPAPYRLDARRCISYLTIEHKGPIPRELRPLIGNRIYGCDDCLAVCPWNKFAQAGREAKLAAREALRAPQLADLARLDDAGFRALFAKSAVKRTGRDRFVRNVLIAIGNSGDAALADEAERLLGDASPLVRGAAVWALGRLDRARLARCSARDVAPPKPIPQVDRRMGGGAGRIDDADADLLRPRLFGRTFRRALRRRLRAHRRHGAQRRARRGSECASCRAAEGARASTARRRRRTCAAPSRMPTRRWSPCRRTRTAIRCCAPSAMLWRTRNVCARSSICRPSASMATTPAPGSTRQRRRSRARRAAASGLPPSSAWQEFGARRGIAVAILRLAGIYGPGRNALVQLARGKARRIVKPGQVFNRIHVADIAQAIDAAFARRASGIFNVADDEPAPPGDPIAFAAQLLGRRRRRRKFRSRSGADDVADGAEFLAGMPARAQRQAQTRARRELAYPTYREGLRALFAAR